MAWGCASQHNSSRSQDWINTEGWTSEKASGSKKYGRSIIIMPELQRVSDKAREYHTNDVQCNHGLDTARRMREGPEKRQRDKNKLCNMKIATLKIETLTGKSRKVADMMSRRRIDILPLQETRWTGVNLGDGVNLY